MAKLAGFRIQKHELLDDQYVLAVERVQRIVTRKHLVGFLLFAFGFALVCTFSIILMQGFKWKGFALDYKFLNWLGGATIGEIGVFWVWCMASISEKGIHLHRPNREHLLKFLNSSTRGRKPKAKSYQGPSKRKRETRSHAKNFDLLKQKKRYARIGS